MEITVQVINGTKPLYYVKKNNNTTGKNIVHTKKQNLVIYSSRDKVKCDRS